MHNLCSEASKIADTLGPASCPVVERMSSLRGKIVLPWSVWSTQFVLYREVSLFGVSFKGGSTVYSLSDFHILAGFVVGDRQASRGCGPL